MPPTDANRNADGEWIDRTLYPFADRWFEAHGCRVHYVDEGQGPTLLLLHGNPTWSFLYREIIGRLKQQFRCIAPDYPGFGLSTAPDGYGFTPAEQADVIEALVVGLDLADVTVMVQDWGGPIGFAVAARHPERFRGFVIGNTWAWPADGNRTSRIFSGVMGGSIGAWAIRRHNAFVEWLIPAGTTSKLPPEVMEHYRTPFADPASRTPTHVFPREIVRSRAFLEEVERGLDSLRDRPALIVWGDKDRAFGLAERRRFESLFENHMRIRLRGAGHFIQEDAPGRIVDAIREWAERSG